MEKNINHYDAINFSRIKWACRRGMLELDVLLGNFCNGCFLHLDNARKEEFVKLLTLSDPEIFNMLLTGSAPPEKFALIVAMIKQYAKLRF